MQNKKKYKRNGKQIETIKINFKNKTSTKLPKVKSLQKHFFCKINIQMSFKICLLNKSVQPKSFFIIPVCDFDIWSSFVWAITDNQITIFWTACVWLYKSGFFCVFLFIYFFWGGGGTLKTYVCNKWALLLSPKTLIADHQEDNSNCLSVWSFSGKKR